MNRPAQAGKGGFSLIEMLAALLIIGVTASSLLVIRNTAIHEARIAKSTQTAWRLAQQKYSALENVPPSRLIPDSGSFPNHEEFRWRTRIREQILETPASSAGNHASSANQDQKRLYRINLIVTYPGKDPGDRKKIKLLLIRLPSDAQRETIKKGSRSRQRQPQESQ